MILIYIILFIASFFILSFASKWLVASLSKIARFLGWKEFVVAFFVMALAGAVPNLSIGISSALHGISQLSLSDIIGGNIIDLTAVIALGVLISKNGLRANGRTVRKSAIFVLFLAFLPLILMLDGVISRIDGVILILIFFVYSFWLFGKRRRFHKSYHNGNRTTFKNIFKNFFFLFGSLILLLLAAEGIVRSATYFSIALNLPLVLIGILIVGLGNALPEMFFTIQAAKKSKGRMIIGNLMGSIIFLMTLVLGIVALISPIKVDDFSPFVIGRFFLIVSAVLFFIFLKTGEKITKKEAWILLFVYIAFVATEIFFY